jgi:hypothetical protein
VAAEKTTISHLPSDINPFKTNLPSGGDSKIRV